MKRRALATCFVLLLTCSHEHPRYSVTIKNTTEQNLDVTLSFPGYSANWPVAAGGQKGELEVPFIMPQSADITWRHDNVVRSQIVDFPKRWPATPKSGDG